MQIKEEWRATPSGLIRARGLGLALSGRPGPFNAITDIANVEVGYATLIKGSGPLVRGSGPVRTGVTAILPRGRERAQLACAAGGFSLNGNGEMTGMIWVEESGQCEGPIAITNTHSLGLVRDALVKWNLRSAGAMDQPWGLPVVGETYDGELNDINGFHVTDADVFAALDGARSGPIEQGSVGGGTGMIAYDFKGGSGTASRVVEAAGGSWILGSFVQANFGIRSELTILGVPVGRHLKGGEVRSKPMGSVIAVVITDAPLLPHQLKRLARRVPLGLARTGSVSHNGSGDIFIALSTANADAFAAGDGPRAMAFLPNDELDSLFEATVETIEEAVIDAMIANRPMTGANDLAVRALPHEALVALLAKRIASSQ
ncbi:MAG: P1 family peptidase [Aestuariivirgaceae bacterium]